MSDIDVELSKSIIHSHLNERVVYPQLSKYKRQRFTIFNRMKAICRKFRLYGQTYFIACNIYDTVVYKDRKFVFCKSNAFLANVFMYMASKFEDIYHIFIYDIVSSEEEKAELILFETKVFELLDFKIPYISTYLFIKQVLQLCPKLRLEGQKMNHLLKLLFENHKHSPNPIENAIVILSESCQMKKQKVINIIKNSL